LYHENDVAPVALAFKTRVVAGQLLVELPVIVAGETDVCTVMEPKLGALAQPLVLVTFTL
jgi:hypothetical protein